MSFTPGIPVVAYYTITAENDVYTIYWLNPIHSGSCFEIAKQIIESLPEKQDMQKKYGYNASPFYHFINDGIISIKFRDNVFGPSEETLSSIENKINIELKRLSELVSFI